MVRLIDAFLNDPANADWQESTKDTFVIDANAVLESLILEIDDVEKIVTIVKKCKFAGTYRKPLSDCARRC